MDIGVSSSGLSDVTYSFENGTNWYSKKVSDNVIRVSTHLPSLSVGEHNVGTVKIVGTSVQTGCNAEYSIENYLIQLQYGHYY